MRFFYKHYSFLQLLCKIKVMITLEMIEDYKKYSSLFPEIQELYKEKYALEFKKSADLPNGSCKLENENRVIDCGLGVRLNGLLEELALLD